LGGRFEVLEEVVRAPFNELALELAGRKLIGSSIGYKNNK